MSLLPIKAQELGAESEFPKHLGGQYGHDHFGRVWVYFQAEEVLVQGDALEVQSYAKINADVDAAAAVNTRRVTGTGDFTTANLVGMFGLDSNHEKGGHVYIFWTDENTAPGQGGPIIKRVDDNLIDVYFVQSDDGLISVAFTTSTDFKVFTLSRLQKAATVHISPHVAYVQRQAGFTDERWGWALVQGLGVTNHDSSETALVAGDKVITSADNGTVEGAVDTTATEGYYGSGTAILNPDADALVPFIANAQINIAPFYTPGNLRTAYPGGQL